MKPLNAKELYLLSTNHGYADGKSVAQAQNMIDELRTNPTITQAGFATQLAGFVYYMYAWGNEEQFRLFCEKAGNHLYLSQIDIYRNVWEQNICGIQEFIGDL